MQSLDGVYTEYYEVLVMTTHHFFNLEGRGALAK